MWGGPQWQRQIDIGNKRPFHSQARKDMVGPPRVTFRFVAAVLHPYSS